MPNPNLCLTLTLTLTRYTRRALRLRLRALPSLAKMHDERPDGLFTIMHINWGSLVLACSGLPTSRFGKASISFAEVQRRIANPHPSPHPEHDPP